MNSRVLMRLIRACGVLVLLFVVQFIAADNWGFQFTFSDTDAWRSFSCIPLPNAPFRFLHGAPGRILLQPSLFVIDNSWHDLAFHGTSVAPTPLAAVLMDLCTHHRLLFLTLVAAINATAWTAISFLVLSVARSLRGARAHSSRPA